MGIPKTIEFDKEVVESSNSAFNPLPAGKYDVTIFSIKAGEFGAPKSPKAGDNEGKPFWNVQYRVENSEDYTNRRLFQTVGLFPRWAPTEKSPDGAANFTLVQFLKAVGVDVEEGGVKIPEVEKLLGKEVTVTVGISTYDPTKNEVKSVSSRADGTTKAKVKTPKPAAAIGTL